MPDAKARLEAAIEASYRGEALIRRVFMDNVKTSAILDDIQNAPEVFK